MMNTTYQAAFDHVWKHFVVDKNLPAYRQREDESIQCQYLTAGGRRCAIGIFFTDERLKGVDCGIKSLYSRSGANIDFVDQLRDAILWRFGDVTTDDLKFLAALQNAHDDAAMNRLEDDDESTPPHAVIQHALRVVADRYNLVIPNAE